MKCIYDMIMQMSKSGGALFSDMSPSKKIQSKLHTLNLFNSYYQQGYYDPDKLKQINEFIIKLDTLTVKLELIEFMYLTQNLSQQLST